MSENFDVESSLIDRFLTRLERIKGDDHSTYRLYRGCLKKYDKWVDIDPKEVAALDIEDYLLYLKNEGYAGNTVSTHFTALRKFYTTVKDKFEVIEDHPCEGVDLKELDVYDRRENDDKVYYVSEDEKEQMIENISDRYYVRDRLVIELFWQTGLRRNELRNIQMDNLDQKNNSIRVYGEKTDEWRTVHYQPSLNRFLDLWIDNERPLMWDSEYLFPSKRAELISAREIGQTVRDAASEINEVVGETQDGHRKLRISTHSLRHGHAVHALKSGVNVRAVQMQLGHKDIDTTMQYLRLVDDDVREAYQGFSG